MRAALLERNQQPLTIANDIEFEGPGPRDVVVKVSHCGICHSDLTMIDTPGGGPLPTVLGHEAAGVVEEVGGSVARLAKGDKVMLTPIPSCGRCYYCVRSEFSLCVEKLLAQVRLEFIVLPGQLQCWADQLWPISWAERSVRHAKKFSFMTAL